MGPSGFNEAPIHESGKCTAIASSGPLSMRCFNEAPIHESGKLRMHVMSPFFRVASMRPRFMNRGSGGVPTVADV